MGYKKTGYMKEDQEKIRVKNLPRSGLVQPGFEAAR